jgi:hypothetical protein
MNLTTQKAVTYIVGLAIVMIPLTALAQYAQEKVEQKTSAYTVCEDNDCKTVAYITPPPVARYELWAKAAFTKAPEKPLTAEERKRRELLGQIRMKEMELARLGAL